ncbi:hypothetical protein [Bartonella sp. LJL80]
MPRAFSKSSVLISGLLLAISGCTVTKPAGDNSAPRFVSLNPIRNVDPDLAQACVNSAANKYYLPTRVIKAVDSRKAGDGSTQVILKVDLRDAVCTVSSGGVVKSVIDTSPKSADQIAAEEQAAKDAATKTSVPAKNRVKTSQRQNTDSSTVNVAASTKAVTEKTASTAIAKPDAAAPSGQSLY